MASIDPADRPRRQSARELRAAAALRSARARSRRVALRRPEGRDIELALGKAVAGVLARRGVVKPDGRVAGVSALQAHPDLAAIVSAATVSLSERYAPGEIAEVLQSTLAGASA